jgi:hypothetical protein
MENNTTVANGRNNIFNNSGAALARFALSEEGRFVDRYDFFEEVVVTGFGQSFILNALSALNTGFDSEQGVERTYNYSLLGETANQNDGFEIIVADPLFGFCGEQSRDLRGCFLPRAQSPSVDAGHPGQRYEDKDGSRNNLGHTGGPHAGPMGFQDDQMPVPQVAMGLRPLTALGEGASLLAVDETLSVAFTLPLGGDFDAELLTVVNLDDDGEIAGTWVAEGSRAIFTPAAALPFGTQIEVIVGAGVGSDRDQVTDRPHRFTVITQPEAITPADALTQISGVMRIDSNTERWSRLSEFVENRQGEVYELSVESGDRLNVSLFSGREVLVGQAPTFELRLLDLDGQTLLDADVDSITKEEESNFITPYIDHVFQVTGTYFLVVLINSEARAECPNPPPNLDGCVWLRGSEGLGLQEFFANGGELELPYELTVAIKPL